MGKLKLPCFRSLSKVSVFKASDVIFEYNLCRTKIKWSLKIKATSKKVVKSGLKGFLASSIKFHYQFRKTSKYRLINHQAIWSLFWPLLCLYILQIFVLGELHTHQCVFYRLFKHCLSLVRTKMEMLVNITELALYDLVELLSYNAILPVATIYCAKNLKAKYTRILLVLYFSFRHKTFNISLVWVLLVSSTNWAIFRTPFCGCTKVHDHAYSFDDIFLFPKEILTHPSLLNWTMAINDLLKSKKERT